MGQGFRDLVAWQKAIAYAKQIYLVSRKFPRDERFGLTSQLRRTAVSISSNLAEGQGRGTSKDFAHFVNMAKGSLNETESQLALARELEYISVEEEYKLITLADELGKIFHGLTRSLTKPP